MRCRSGRWLCVRLRSLVGEHEFAASDRRCNSSFLQTIRITPVTPRFYEMPLCPVASPETWLFSTRRMRSVLSVATGGSAPVSCVLLTSSGEIQ
jgi:hypothetical protein